MRDDPRPSSRGQDCCRHSNFFHSLVIRLFFGTCTMSSPLSTDRPWPSTAVDSLVFRFTRMCSTSRFLVPSTSLDDLFVTSTGVIQIFCNKCSRLVNTDPFMGLHREPRVCQVETSELGLILFFFPFTLRMIRSGIGLSHWPLYNQVLQ